MLKDGTTQSLLDRLALLWQKRLRRTDGALRVVVATTTVTQEFTKNG